MMNWQHRLTFMPLVVLFVALLALSGCGKTTDPASLNAVPDMSETGADIEVYVSAAKAYATRNAEAAGMDMPPDDLKRANQLFKQGNYKVAITAYDQYLVRYPASWAALNNRGLSELNMGRNEEAMVSFLSAYFVAQDKHPETLINMLAAGQALDFPANVILGATFGSTYNFREALKSSYNDKSINEIINAISYNIVYMNMGGDPNARAYSWGNQDVYKHINNFEPKHIISMLEDMAATGDEDAEDLLAYYMVFMNMNSADDGGDQ